MYKNLSRLMHNKIVNGQVIEQARLRFPIVDSERKHKFIKEMLDLQKEIKNDLWRCNHPNAAGYHDDYCDSTCLACLAFLPKQETRKQYRPMIG